MDVNEELKLFVKIPKKKFFFGGGGRGRGQGGCERRIEVFVKIFFWGGGRRGVGGSVGGVGLGGVRVDVNEELKFL